MRISKDQIKNKYIGKSQKYLINKAQECVNAYVRKRDDLGGFFECMACKEIKPSSQANASHYFPKEVKQYSAVRFDLDNLWVCCIRCNHYLSGNLIPYRKNLIEKIGIERFENLERLSNVKNFKHDRFILIDIIERFKKL